MRLIGKHSCAVIPLLIGLASPGAAQGDLESRIGDIVRPLLAEVPGLAVTVGMAGEIVYSEAFGHAALDPAQPATRATFFRVYSVSKPWTVAAGLRLAGKGVIDPQAPVHAYVPEFPEKGAPITMEQLATHRSGIRHYVGDEAWTNRVCASPADAFETFSADPLLFSPGSAEAYSTWGFVLLSAAMEAAARRPFADVMGSEVFGHAGMSAVAYGEAGKVAAARGYERDGNSWMDITMTTNPSCRWGGGGFLATADDLALFPMAALAGRLLPPELVALLFERQDGPVNHAGGSGPGGSAHVRTDTASDLVVAIAANTGGVQPLLREVSERIAAAVQRGR
jgi:CubicO group peptidase (beta-lactamase class C family)